MSRVLDPDPVLRHLAERLDDVHWDRDGLVLSGRLAGRACRSRHFDSGPTVALSLDRASWRAGQIGLLLAATPAACDDGLYLEGGRLWLLRRFQPRLNAVEFDLLLKQQQALAALLAERPGPAAVGLPAIGRIA